MIELTFYADFICPFCYGAERGLLPHLEARADVRVTWRPFELHPETPTQGRAIPERDAGRIWARSRRIAAEWGLPIARKAPKLRANTRRALAAAEAARDAGQLERFRAAAYRAWWVDGRDLGAPEVLGALLPEVDLDNDRWDATVQSVRAAAIGSGISAVPAFAIGADVLYGLQDLDALERFIAGHV